MKRAASLLRLALDPAAVMAGTGRPPDPWQTEFLRAAADGNGFRGLLLTSRQAGKSTTIAALCVWWALVRPRHDVVVIAPTLWQASEIIVKARDVAVGLGLRLVRDAAKTIVLANGGRIMALAGRGQVRGPTAGLVVVDEGAWLPDQVMTSVVMPMLAAVPGGGALVAASTPAGQQGWFHDWYELGGDNYARWKVPYTEVPRITEAYAEQYRAAVPRQVWAAEMLCSFEESGGGIWLPQLVDAAFVDADTVPVDLPVIPDIDWSTAA